MDFDSLTSSFQVLRLEAGTTIPNHHGTILRALCTLSYISRGGDLKEILFVFLYFAIIPWDSVFIGFHFVESLFKPKLSFDFIGSIFSSLKFPFKLIFSYGLWSFFCVSQRLKHSWPLSLPFILSRSWVLWFLCVSVDDATTGLFATCF